MTIAIQAVQERLTSFAARVNSWGVPTRTTTEGLVEEAHQVLRSLSGAEGHHITLALEVADFPFEDAQSQLDSCVREFARLSQEVLDAQNELLTREETARLEELTFLALNAPRASRSTLATIRVARATPAA